MNRSALTVRMLSLSLAIVFGLSVAVAASRSSLDGTYTLDSANSDNINVAIDDALAKVNFLKRFVARERLRKLNPSYRSVTIAFPANEISITVDNQPVLRTPANGTPIDWVGPDGAKVRVTMRMSGGHLLQEFDAPDGHRVNDYTLSPDGRTLTMQVTETSSRLSQTIRYKQVYKRVS